MTAHDTPRVVDPASAAFDVVILVASSGGLGAISRILTDLPVDFAAPVVVMQHLGGNGSALVNILRRRIQLPVNWIHDGEGLTPAQVHIAPPGKGLEILPDRTCALSKERTFSCDRVLDELLR